MHASADSCFAREWSRARTRLVQGPQHHPTSAIPRFFPHPLLSSSLHPIENLGVKVISQGLWGPPIYLLHLVNFSQIGRSWGAEQSAVRWPSPLTSAPSQPNPTLQPRLPDPAEERFTQQFSSWNTALHLSPLSLSLYLPLTNNDTAEEKGSWFKPQVNSLGLCYIFFCYNPQYFTVIQATSVFDLFLLFFIILYLSIQWRNIHLVHIRKSTVDLSAYMSRDHRLLGTEAALSGDSVIDWSSTVLLGAGDSKTACGCVIVTVRLIHGCCNNTELHTVGGKASQSQIILKVHKQRQKILMSFCFM